MAAIDYQALELNDALRLADELMKKNKQPQQVQQMQQAVPAGPNSGVPDSASPAPQAAPPLPAPEEVKPMSIASFLNGLGGGRSNNLHDMIQNLSGQNPPIPGIQSPQVQAANNAPNRGILNSIFPSGSQNTGFIPGNIDLNNRPVVRNPDGSISTVRTISFNEDGKEVLIPTVLPNGTIADDESAIDFYHQSGQHFGKFNTPDEATGWAQSLHRGQEKQYADAIQPQPQQQQGLFGRIGQWAKDNNILDRVADVANGWAMGGTPSQSIALGGLNVQQGNQTRKRENQTVKWLTSLGFSEDQSRAIIQDKNLMNTALTSKIGANTPEAMLKRQQIAAQIEHTRAQTDALRKSGKAKPPQITSIYDPATGMEKKVQWNKDKGEWEDIGGIKAPSGTTLMVDPNTGAVTFQQGQGVKSLTEGQSKDTVFATRARGTLPILNKLENSLTELGSSVGSKLPVGGNYLKSKDYQQAEQAGREFLQAILRKDTGAAITPAETREYNAVYLPQPGDTVDTIRQKRISRERAVAALEAGMPTQAILNMETALRKTGSPMLVKTPKEYADLPSGAEYVAPDGSQRRKP